MRGDGSARALQIGPQGNTVTLPEFQGAGPPILKILCGSQATTAQLSDLSSCSTVGTTREILARMDFPVGGQLPTRMLACDATRMSGLAN